MAELETTVGRTVSRQQDHEDHQEHEEEEHEEEEQEEEQEEEPKEEEWRINKVCLWSSFNFS